LAHPDDPQRALSADAPADVVAPPAPTPATQPARSFSPRFVAALFVASLAACLIAYLALASSRWFAGTSDLSFGVDRLAITRGSGDVANGRLVVTQPGDDGNAIVSVTSDFRARDFPIVAFRVENVPAGVKVALLWRTDVEPARVNTVPLDVVSGRAMPIDLQGNAHWLGRIAGLGLVLNGRFEQPVEIQGAVAKSGDAASTLRDRVDEWLTPETFAGASINTIAGGADGQALPLPLLLACAIALAIGVFAWMAHRRGAAAALASGSIALVLAGWLVLDARWTKNLAHNVDLAARRYAGKDLHAKHLAADDANLYAFIDDARRLMPERGARVFVVANADFFRGRAAYHLYPLNVWFDAYHDVLPPPSQLKSGDWLVVYERRGVQYDAARKRLRFEGVTIPAELRLLEHGGALFALQGTASTATADATAAHEARR
jgi:hypothetical protein